MLPCIPPVIKTWFILDDQNVWDVFLFSNKKKNFHALSIWFLAKGNNGPVWGYRIFFFSFHDQCSLGSLSASPPALGSSLERGGFYLAHNRWKGRMRMRHLLWLRASPHWPRDKRPASWRPAVKNEPIVFASLYLAVCNLKKKKKNFYIAPKKTILMTSDSTGQEISHGGWTHQVSAGQFCVPWQPSIPPLHEKAMQRETVRRGRARRGACRGELRGLGGTWKCVLQMCPSLECVKLFFFNCIFQILFK